MAGLKGNVAWFALAKQSGKGSVPAAATDLLAYSGGSGGPTRQIDQLSETDATRNQGVSYVQQTAVEGSPECYVRDSNMHHVLEAVLGTKVTSGATNFTHTLTPATSLSYYTFWRMLGGVLWEQHNDCMVNEVTISADAGSPLTASVNYTGRSSTRLTSDPSGSWAGVSLSQGTVYNYNDAAVTLAGGATALVGSFECTITNNVTLQQTDDSVPYDVVPGQFQVTLAFDLIFETLDEYNRFHTGSISGTAQSPAIATTTANFTFTKGANNSVNFDFPSIAYEEFPVDPDPGGAPVVASVRARAQRSGSPFLTAVVKNQVAT